jgi:hypothetical protein
MNYKIVPMDKAKNYLKYAVVENQTKYVIELFVKREDARQFARVLNLGAGFDGWSPSFIATKEKI